ncbi:MAG: undecaprenyl-diphosphate phosphatase [Clostridia bacterium]|nr:undecaprenyl-diphosphate phosphatase [Clostridia bacterium]
MSVWIILILGIVQGLTEFLPISSSGHLVIIEKYANVGLDNTLINVVLHFSTLLAVCIFYRKKLWQMIKHPFSKQTLCLIIATVPAVLFVLVFNDFIINNLTSSLFVGIGFLVTAVLLLVADASNRRTRMCAKINYGHSTIMGIAQAFAIFPGLSRSGTTLAFGLMSGVQKDDALDFSFLMSVPIILGSLIYEIVGANSFESVVGTDILYLCLGGVFAFLTACLSIKFMQNIIKRMKLWWFVPYLIILGILVIVL